MSYIIQENSCFIILIYLSGVLQFLHSKLGIFSDIVEHRFSIDVIILDQNIELSVLFTKAHFQYLGHYI